MVRIASGVVAQPDVRALSLQRALQAMASGETSSVELTAKALIAAEACRNGLNAFSVIAHDIAMAEARESERYYKQGRPRPLEGVPIAVKDLIDTEAIETRYGSAAYLGHVPARDASIVRTLREAGAVIIGKTTTHEFAWGVTTASITFGDTLNPREPTRIPGGSSGGAAAAVAYGAIATSLGTDTGGSARIPAALCGAVGFKPSFGLLSTEGIMPLAPSLDHPGILASSTDDVILMMRALGIEACPSGKRLSLGVLRQIASVPIEATIAARFDGAIRRLGETHVVSEVSNSQIFDNTFSIFATLVLVEGAMTHLARNDDATISTGYSAETQERIARAKATAIGDYASAQAQRRDFVRHLTALADQFDYLLLPTCPCVAPRVGSVQIEIGRWRGSIREALMTYTAPFNLAGLPAISIYCDTDAPLPWGLQVVGRKGKDSELLADADRIAGILTE